MTSLRLLMRPDGKSKGLAFVKYSSKASFNKALELNGSDQFGRNITVEESHGRKEQDGGFKKPFGNGAAGGFNKGNKFQGSEGTAVI